MTVTYPKLTPEQIECIKQEAHDLIMVFLSAGQIIISNDTVFKEIATKLQIYSKNKSGEWTNDIKVSRLGLGMTRIW